jgi:hypothetical protein
MKKISIYKNGLYVGEFMFDETGNESLKQFVIKVANVNINANYRLEVKGDIVRTYKNK